MKTAGDRIKHVRKLRRFSQEKLGELVGVSKVAVSRLESGLSKAPTPENLFNYSKALRVNAEWLATGKGEMDDENTSRIDEILAEAEVKLTDGDRKVLDQLKDQPEEVKYKLATLISSLIASEQNSI